MNERVVFYQLTHKFVNQEQNIPEDARQVVYYSLAIGHHVGVMDCFQSLMEVPLDEYREWVSQLPEGTARHKMEGVLKWGEIEVNKEHAGGLLPLLNEPWTKPFAQSLQAMMKEPALYLMIRKMT
ncbi:MAG: formate hydrogenlyase maturation protein HycH [Anaerolineales bacterium]|nr:formate hydrogenlyase maturation protein HycH [Anaerolineales bacterium]